MKKRYTISIAMAVLCLVGCNSVSEQEKEKQISFGNYFYIDNADIIHSDRECNYIATSHGAKPIDVLEIKELGKYALGPYCSQCLNEEDFKFIQKKRQIHLNREKVSNALYKNGYNVESFDDWIDTCGEEKYKWCYDRMKEYENNYVIPSLRVCNTYEEFKEFIGVDNKREETVFDKSANDEGHYIKHIYLIIGIAVILFIFVLFMVHRTRKTGKKKPSLVNREDIFQKKKRILELNIRLLNRNPKDLKKYNATLNVLHDILVFLDEEIAARDCVDDTIRKHLADVTTIMVNEGFYYDSLDEVMKRFKELSDSKDPQILRLNVNYILHQCWIGYDKRRSDYENLLQETVKK